MFGIGKSVGVLMILSIIESLCSIFNEICFVDVKYNAKKIVSFITEDHLRGIIEIGSKNGIILESLRNSLNSDSVFEGRDDTQIPIDPPDDAPDANEVISFAKSLIEHN